MRESLIFVLLFGFFSANCQILTIEQTLFYINQTLNADIKNGNNLYEGTKQILVRVNEGNISVKYIWDGNENVLFFDYVNTKVNYNEINFNINDVMELKKKDFKKKKTVTLQCKDKSKKCFKLSKEAIMWNYSSEFADRPNAVNHYDFIHLFYLNNEKNQDRIFNAMSYLISELENKENEVNLENPFSSFSTNSFKPTNKEVIQLRESSGVSTLKVNIGGVETEVILDSGASDVSVPRTFETLLQSYSVIGKEDYIEPGLYTIANGSVVSSNRFIIPYITVEGITVKNVRCSVNDSEDIFLLGKSFLNRFKSWKQDNNFNQLILEY